jgi:hypothetical protein
MKQDFVGSPRTASIVPPLKRNWKLFQLAVILAVTALAAGCSGIHASKSISPLDFILPGLMKNEAPASQEFPPALPSGELPV